MSKSKKVEYKSMDQRSHVIHRPDMYIGSVKPKTEEVNVALVEETEDSVTYKISKETVTYPPGLLRIFIEPLSNAIDNVWRSKEFGEKVSKIEVEINESGETSIWNDGMAISIELNNEGMYNPDSIFGKLLTSSNYNDEEERKTSGRNGLGVKLTNIFSKEFSIEVFDPKNSKKYVQTWKDNMEKRGEPKITSKKAKNGYTKVSWTPDFEKFGLEGYTDGIIALMTKYVLDAAMVTGVNFYLNGKKIPVKSLKDYALLYPHVSDEMVVASSADCDVVVMPSSGAGEVISFVNGVETSEGGVHVEAWTNAVLRPVMEKINGKKGNSINMRDMKNYFRFFIVATLTNPEFSSQEKTKLVAPTPKPDVPPKVANSIMRWSVIEEIKNLVKSKELNVLKKVEKGRGFKKIEGLDPANNAGGKNGRECTLILCEGLSAKTYAVKGIDVGSYGKKGRDWYGIYPLRGKLLNVRNASPATIAKNREITDVIQALGIKHGVDYTDDKNFNTLRYGRLMILTDSDVDGIHIAGLILNFIHTLFPSILKRDEPFIVNMRTPIVRIYDKKELTFYTLEEFKEFQTKNPNHKGRVKYFKGLGTSNDKEIRESFGQKIVEFVEDGASDSNMNKVFHSKHADDRKEWLEKYNPDNVVTFGDRTNVSELTISEFIDGEMIRFSIDDCKRSIPNVLDGLKESHRKILYAAMLKGLKFSGDTMKVAQLAGFVAEKTNYHHGEQCLFDTITKMAHEFVGSNNIPLFFRDGQFGSRLEGGKDAANARYIFTKLEKLTRFIFREEDDPILERVVDDGDVVEPKFYVPILPMVLVNGCIAGIGTGWSTSIPAFDPLVVVEAIKSWIANGNTCYKETEEGAMECVFPEMNPWYRGFTGVVEKVSDNKWVTHGSIVEQGKSLVIKELPVGMWTDKYKEFIEDGIEAKTFKDYKNYSTPNKVHFIVDKNGDEIPDMKLRTSISTTNMVLFDGEEKLQRFQTVDEILEYFCSIRLNYYSDRKTYQLEKLRDELKWLKNRERFLREVIEKKLIVQERDEDELISEMVKKKFDKKEDSFNYLLNQAIRSFSRQKLESLRAEIEKIEKEIKEIEATSVEKMWIRDLDEFKVEYLKWLDDMSKLDETDEKAVKKPAAKKK